MKVVFRADASIQIGTGHVMRCLTLADALAAQGAKCEFICREHPGNLIAHIQNKSYNVHSLSMGKTADTDLPHSKWLGSTQAQDAEVCASLLSKLQPDWLVVDHYAIDARWETALTPYYRKLMVIDDLADRQHICSLLLDQNLGRTTDHYTHLVPNSCNLLCGTNYALLRPEFAALRAYSLQRRAQPELKRLLVTMGGVDQGNVTAQVLKYLRASPLPKGCEITVVMGATAPWLADIQQQAQTMPWPTTVYAGANNMAQLMAESDLAIGAAGSTSWERCCLGLPTLLLVLAENQANGALALEESGAAIALQNPQDIPHAIEQCLSNTAAHGLSSMSMSSAKVSDGEGVQRIMAKLFAEQRLD